MSILKALRLFHQRRIAVPVAQDALVLDVGSGDKPSWRADVLLDRYTGAEYAGQRSGRAAAVWISLMERPEELLQISASSGAAASMAANTSRFSSRSSRTHSCT